MHTRSRPADEYVDDMRCFYFVRTSKKVGVWTRHYATATEADDAFYATVRLFYPVPAILYDWGYPQYSYYAYLAKADAEKERTPESYTRTELNF